MLAENALYWATLWVGHAHSDGDGARQAHQAQACSDATACICLQGSISKAYSSQCVWDDGTACRAATLTSQSLLFAEPNGQLSGVLLKVVEDTPQVYNLLVCTLCSWYGPAFSGFCPVCEAASTCTQSLACRP